MAAPVSKGRRARAPRRLARLRRQRRRAAERVRRLRPPRAARRHRARARDEGEARLRRGDSRPRCSTPGAPRVDAPCAHYPACGGCRFQDLAYEAQIAAKARRRCATRSCGSGGIADPPLEPILPAESAVPLPQQARVLVHRHAAGRGARLPPGRALGRGARGRALLADDRPRQRDPRRPCATGRRRRACRRSTRRRRPATCATSSSARGGTPARRSSSSSPRRATSRAPTGFVDGAARVPRGALDPLGGERLARPR